MTDEQLAAIRARCEAATPGPWDAHANIGYCGIMADGDKRPLLRADTCTFADGAFIAHAREDVPALLDEVARLRAKARELDDRLHPRRGW